MFGVANGATSALVGNEERNTAMDQNCAVRTMFMYRF